MHERTATVLVLGGIVLGVAGIARHRERPTGSKLKTLTDEEMATYWPAQQVLAKGRRGYIVVSSCLSYKQVKLLDWVATRSKKLLYFKRRDDALDPCLLIEAGHRRDDGTVEIARIEADYIAQYTKHWPQPVITASPQVTMALDFAVDGVALDPVGLYQPTGGG